MRIPVFSCGSDPARNPPIFRKSLHYCERQVGDLLANWVKPGVPAAGIIARGWPGLLPPDREPQPEPARPELPPIEIDGIKFDDPEKDREKLAERARLVQQARMVTYFGSDKDLSRIAAEEA